jgi:hypothetical protein
MAKKQDRHAAEAEQIKAFLADGDVGHTLLLTEAILTMALRAHIELSPEIAATLYLAACGEITNYHDSGRALPSPFEVDSILSICHARIPVLHELERYERIKFYRRKQVAVKKKGGTQ